MAKHKEKPSHEEAVKIASNVDVKKYKDRIIKLRSEMNDLRGDIKGVYDEASNAGLDRKALKLLIKEIEKPIPTEERLLCNAYLEKCGQLALFSELGE